MNNIDVYKRRIKKESNNSHAHYNLGNLYLSIEENEKAVECYEKVITQIDKIDKITLEKKDSNLNLIYINLGNAYLNIGDNEKAIEQYKKAINEKIDYTDAYYNLNLGNAYFNISKNGSVAKFSDKSILV